MKTPKTRNDGTWSESRYYSQIRSFLRRAFRWWIPMNKALLAARRPYQGTNKQAKWQFLCAECGEWYMRKNVQIDHKIECGALRCAEDIAGFIERLTPEDPAAFQVLCKQCHSKKTKAATKRQRKP